MSAGGATTERAALLEEFAEACTEVARGLAPKGGTIEWEAGKDGFVHFHCPLPGLRGPHTWNGGPRASAWVKAGAVEATCGKCVGGKGEHPDQAAYEAARLAYTVNVKRAIRWEQDGVVHAGFKTEVLRSHLYFDRDFKHAVRRDKVRYEDGRKERGNHNPWRWRVAALGPDGKPGQFSPMHAEPWLAQHYPEHDKLYDALCWYAVDAFWDLVNINGPLTAATLPLRQSYRVVVCEGEKDVDTFNALMAAAGRDGISATCMCHPKPSKLASHHARLVAGREVVVVGDADDAGKDQAENWTALLWGHASSIKLVREQLGLSGGADDKDLTDWVVARTGLPPGGERLAEWLAKSPASTAAADELLGLFASTAPLLEPAGRPTEWRSNMIENKGGGAKADSPHNAERVWTMHPLLRGRVRTNTRSGEVEVVDPPWGGSTTTGSRNAATLCSMWLERTEKMSLSTKVLDEVVRQDLVAPLFNPLQDLLDGEWDGQPRLDGLFTTYVPLKAKPVTAVMLARSMLEDLVRKMRGEPASQRLLVGVETAQGVDLAGALMGRHGYQHRGKISDRDVERFARLEAIMVQISQEPVANRQAAMASLPHIFAADTWLAQRRLSAPLYLAVGTPPADDRTRAKIDERVHRYALAGRPRLDDLRDDAPQIIAEAVAMVDGQRTTALPDKDDQHEVDRLELLADVSAVVQALWLYVTRDVEGVDLLNPRALSMANRRAEPRRHVVRDQFITIMKAALQADFREVHAQGRAFNAMCRAFGWPLKLGLTNQLANQLGVDIGTHSKVVVVGVLMNDEKIMQLNDHLFPPDDAPPPPKGGGQPEQGGTTDGADSFADPTTGDDCEYADLTTSDDCEYMGGDRFKGESTATPDGGPEFAGGFAMVCPDGLPLGNPGGTPGLLEPLGGIELRKDKKDAIAGVTRHDSTNKPRAPKWLAGQEAVDAVRAILATPGVASIDFETYPTRSSWHGDEAAARALRGSKAQARADAVLAAQMGGRALQRRACTLQLAHEDGQEVFVRLEPGDDDVARAKQLQAMFEGRVADLVAFNALFECEILLKHGVAVDLEDPMLAAKALTLTAVAEDQPQPQEYSLKALVKRYLGVEMDKSVRDRDWRLEESLTDEAVAYGLADARLTLQLWNVLEKLLKETEA